MRIVIKTTIYINKYLSIVTVRYGNKNNVVSSCKRKIINPTKVQQDSRGSKYVLWVSFCLTNGGQRLIPKMHRCPENREQRSGMSDPEDAGCAHSAFHHALSRWLKSRVLSSPVTKSGTIDPPSAITTTTSTTTTYPSVFSGGGDLLICLSPLLLDLYTLHICNVIVTMKRVLFPISWAVVIHMSRIKGMLISK